MTSNTPEAPERIWRWKYQGRIGFEEKPFDPSVEYTRTDISQAHIAAAYEAAAGWCASHTMDNLVNASMATHGGVYVPGEYHGEGHHHGLGYADAIRALTPQDAQAALDAVRAEERERCAKVAENWNNSATANHAKRGIAAAIRESGNG